MSTQEILDALLFWAMADAMFETETLHRLAVNMMVLEAELAA